VGALPADAGMLAPASSMQSWMHRSKGAPMAWLILAIAIASEVFATTMLKLSDGFSRLTPAIGVVLGYGLSFFLLAIALKSIGLSTAYAIWAGVGTVGAVLVGVLVFGESLTLPAYIGIALVVTGVVLLNAAAHN
jgi:multidrug transporter EmrE-like cation transporter